jgi:spore coat protein A
MSLSRRQFIALGGVLGVGAAYPSLQWGSGTATAAAEFHPMSMKAMTAIPGLNGAALSALGPAVFVKTRALAKFAQPLRGVYPLDPNGIPVAIPDGTVRYLRGKVVAQHYTFDIAEYTDQLHPDLPSTTLWGFHSRTNLGGAVPQRHLGGIIIAEKGVPIQMTVRNQLPSRHPLPVDTSVMGAELAPNRTCVHFHGGEVPWISDGGPHAWFRPDNTVGDTSPLYGPSALSAAGNNIYKTLNPNLLPGEAEYYYPMNQSARFGWYHDHSMGITRLNAYAGIASALIIRDNFERSLVPLGMPDFIEKGGREIPLVIQDKIFQDEAQDPDYPGNKATGSLWYPYRYTDRWAAVEGSDAADLPISAIPEMFGDTMLVNGVVHPQVTLEPRRYRFRVLNATQARFLNLQLYEVGTSPSGAEVADFGKPGPDYLVLGTEGGFLARAVTMPSGNRLTVTVDPVTGDRSVDPANPGGSLITGPAERWDLIVDFSKFAGKRLVLFNDTPAPFPGGDSTNDGDLDTDPAGNTVLINQLLMRIDVAAGITGPADPPLQITHGFPLAANTKSGINRALVGSWSTMTTKPVGNPRDTSKVRRLTLNELFDEHGRLIQMLGTNQLVNPAMDYSLDPMAPGFDVGKTTAMAYMDPVTESPKVGDTEVWEIANLTADVHPMHFHLVNVQVLGRRPFSGYTFDAAGKGTPTGLGAERGPDATELGWKDTVRMNPGEVTRVAMKFDLTPVPFAVPASPRTGGNEFVWHCHILEHEEHDMMRPLIVRGTNPRIT